MGEGERERPGVGSGIKRDDDGGKILRGRKGKEKMGRRGKRGRKGKKGKG